MEKQTYIIYTSGGGCNDFHRVSCKRVETCLKYIKNWKIQAKEKGWDYLFKDLLSDDARYKIVATPDGYNPTEIIATGLVSEL